MSAQSDSSNKTTRLARAKRTLEGAGWTCLPPAPKRCQSLADQCEYPDRHGDPGDTCTNSTRRERRTKYGTFWLCSQHFDAPLSELFDERIANG